MQLDLACMAPKPPFLKLDSRIPSLSLPQHHRTASIYSTGDRIEPYCEA